MTDDLGGCCLLGFCGKERQEQARAQVRKEKEAALRLQLELAAPVEITPRLLAGVRIRCEDGPAWISIEYGGVSADRRRIYKYHIDTPAFSFSKDDVKSGVGGGDLREGLGAVLSFLGACAESWDEKEDERGENADLFPPEVARWAKQNSDEIGTLRIEVEETKDCIKEKTA